MSMWFLTNAAQAINAQVAGLFDKIPETMYFGTIGLISIVLGGILLFALADDQTRDERGLIIRNSPQMLICGLFFIDQAIS